MGALLGNMLLNPELPGLPNIALAFGGAANVLYAFPPGFLNTIVAFWGTALPNSENVLDGGFVSAQDSLLFLVLEIIILVKIEIAIA